MVSIVSPERYGHPSPMQSHARAPAGSARPSARSEAVKSSRNAVPGKSMHRPVVGGYANPVGVDGNLLLSLLLLPRAAASAFACAHPDASFVVLAFVS